MDGSAVFSGASILAAALNGMGGTEPLFVNVSGGNYFKMRVSFAFPSTEDAEVMQDIDVLGDVANTEHETEQNACVVAFWFLWQNHGRIILDYSLLRVWCCEERHAGLLEKPQQGKSSFERISAQSLEVVNSFLPASVLFAQKIDSMRTEGADDAAISYATSCVAFLQMMHVRGMIVHQQGMNQLHAMFNHGKLSDVLHAEGFILPENTEDFINEIGGIRMMLDRVVDMLDFNPPPPPLSRIETRDVSHKCFIAFSPVAAGGSREFTAFGHVSSTIARATETAIYNALLALCVNHGVQIEDVHREAYVFARDRVTEIGTDLEVLGNLGSSMRAYLDRTHQGLRRMVGSYSQVIGRYPSGVVLSDKLQSLLSEVGQCLDSITAPVRCMNENAIVGSLPF